MKKFLLIVMFFVAGVTQLKAEDTIVDVTQCYNGLHFYICINKYDRMAITIPTSCTDYSLTIGGEYHYENPVILDGNEHDFYRICFYGCGITSWIEFYVNFIEPEVPNSMTRELWKHQGYPISLESIGADSLEMYDFHWSTGETTPTIEITEPGTYTCGISDRCATATRTFIVQDNVEVYRATVDLATNLNKVTWQTSTAQAEYISQLKVERDGMVVGTVPYMDGQFVDNIGSENAARNYRLTGITTEGEECPIPSYQYGTLHVDYSPNASNPNKLNMAWTPPFIEEGAPLTVTYFQICKYDPITDEVTIIDQIGANNTIGSYDVSLFDGGYAVVAALFNEGKDYEDVAFSNLTEEILGVGENVGNLVRVYPNPANGRFTVEGTGIMHITNVLGQEIMAKEINGKETVVLPKGMYIVQLNGAVRKIMVE